MIDEDILKNMQPFHLAFPVNDITEAKSWYTKVLGCSLGRESEKWIDFNFFGHQISAHLDHKESFSSGTNNVDGDNIPVRHFGLILDWDKWHELSKKLISMNIKFIVKPQIRFEGRVGEQATMFLPDPSGNVLEFKSFRNPDDIFRTDMEIY